VLSCTVALMLAWNNAGQGHCLREVWLSQGMLYLFFYSLDWGVRICPCDIAHSAASCFVEGEQPRTSNPRPWADASGRHACMQEHATARDPRVQTRLRRKKKKMIKGCGHPASHPSAAPTPSKKGYKQQQEVIHAEIQRGTEPSAPARAPPTCRQGTSAESTCEAAHPAPPPHCTHTKAAPKRKKNS